jgi:acetyl esterase/lipase
MMCEPLRLAALGALAVGAVRGYAQAPAPTHNDLAYAEVLRDDGTSKTLHMDVWLSPADGEPAPLVIWIHGGAWLGGTYNAAPPGLQAMLQRGLAVASIQYRLSGESIFPAQIHDVKGAVRFLRQRAEQYNLDANRFASFGSSAGGHLAALLATSGGVEELEGDVGGNLEASSRIQAVIDFFGPTDLLQMNLDVTTPPGSVLNHDAPNSPESQLIGFDGPGQGVGVLRANLDNPAAPFPEKAELARLVNPLTHVDADDPPAFIAHGNQDNVVPYNQSQRLATALEEVEVSHVFRPVLGAGHGFGNQDPTVIAEALEFITSQWAPIDGDFEDDGDVDGADLLQWQQNHAVGSLDDWRANFGRTWRDPATAAVPEPGGRHAWLLGGAIVVARGAGTRSERGDAEVVRRMSSSPRVR